MQYQTIPCNIMQYRSIPCNTIPCSVLQACVFFFVFFCDLGGQFGERVGPFPAQIPGRRSMLSFSNRFFFQSKTAGRPVCKFKTVQFRYTTSEWGERRGCKELQLWLVEVDIMDRYKVLDLIGEGSFGRVFRGVHRETGASVALKLIPKVFFIPKFFFYHQGFF